MVGGQLRKTDLFRCSSFSSSLLLASTLETSSRSQLDREDLDCSSYYWKGTLPLFLSRRREKRLHAKALGSCKQEIGANSIRVRWSFELVQGS